MPSEGIQGDEWETYGVLETFLGDGNTGWPMAREDQGHGVAVVVVGITSHQGAQESYVQGEADRRSERRGPGGTRDADGQTRTGTHGGTTGELAEIKRLTVSSEGDR